MFLFMRLLFQHRPTLAKEADVRAAAGDGERVWGAAHRLKALAGLVGARALVEACAVNLPSRAECRHEL